MVTLAASARSAGKTYEEAVGGRWKMDTPMPEAVKKLVVMNVAEVEKVAATVDFVFSAVDMSKEEIKAIEEEYAKTRHNMGFDAINKLSQKYNVLGLVMTIDKDENCKIIDAIYQKNKDTYYTQLHLPKTVLTAGEYIDIMKRL